MTIHVYVVSREEQHIDPKIWVFTTESEAVKVAKSLEKYWVKQYKCAEIDIYRKTLDSVIWNCCGEGFRIWIEKLPLLDKDPK